MCRIWRLCMSWGKIGWGRRQHQGLLRRIDQTQQYLFITQGKTLEKTILSTKKPKKCYQIKEKPPLSRTKIGNSNWDKAKLLPQSSTRVQPIWTAKSHLCQALVEFRKTIQNKCKQLLKKSQKLKPRKKLQLWSSKDMTPTQMSSKHLLSKSQKIRKK